VDVAVLVVLVVVVVCWRFVGGCAFSPTMSVTAYDNSFSFRQNELATKGEPVPRGMSAEQFAKFQESPFMKKARMQEETTWTLTSERDKQRKARDPAFNPQESDFTASKAYNYEKIVNYYKVLGIDEFASLDEVKKAYKKLSLLYHPDKTTSLPKEEQDESASIFIELKNAYMTLNDQATRRQYDRDRDHNKAGEEVNGWKKKGDKVSFDAREVLKKLQERQKPPGKVNVVEVPCKLEKFFYGGAKRYTRTRKVIREHFEFYEDKNFRIDLPRGAPEGWECDMKGGDMNFDTQPDTMKFVLASKLHAVVARDGADLLVKKPVLLKPDAHLQSYLNFNLHTLGGRTIMIWGRNPAYSQVGAANAELDVRIRGEGVGSTGFLQFRAKFQQPQGSGSSFNIVVSVTTTYTKIQFFCSVHAEATVEDLHQAIRDVLQWPEDQPVNITKPGSDKSSVPFQSHTAKLGGMREVLLDPAVRLYELPMSVRRARELLNSVNVLASTESFERELRKCCKRRGLPEFEHTFRQLWDDTSRVAPLYGYRVGFDGLKVALQRALWVVADEPDAPILQQRFVELGFRPRKPPKVKIARRRKLPIAAVDLFLARNGLGPPSWGPNSERIPEPGSETDTEKSDDPEPGEDDCADMLFGGSSASDSRPSYGRRSGARPAQAHGSFAAAVHPAMLKRTCRREEVAPVCELELLPLFGAGEGLQLYTKPTCSLYFYSNLQQTWTVKPGHLRPQPCFAIAVSCPSGAKRTGRDAWARLRHSLVPMLRQAAFLLLREARGILPLPLPSEAAFSDEAYRAEEGARAIGLGDDGALGELVGDVTGGLGEEDDERDILAIAKHRVAQAAAAAGDGLAGGMFDFEDLEDLDKVEEAADQIRQERWELKRRRSAVREVWSLDARRQAKQSEFFLRNSEKSSPSGEPSPTPALWKQMANRAFGCGDYFSAQAMYARELADLPSQDVEARAIAHSNRALCFLKIEHFSDALQDARVATELRPSWGRAWARFGAAAGHVSGASSEQAREAWFRAVTHDPNEAHMEGLFEAHRSGSGSSSLDRAHERKEKGNEATRALEWGAAVAHYTVALAMVPPPPSDPRKKDDCALLRSILHGNRCSALSRVKAWGLAEHDGKKAVEHKDDYGKAYLRLGVAQLGCGSYEKAYSSFARALHLDEKDQSARRGREVCLSLIPRWDSRVSQRRRNRFARDSGRPASNTKVYAISEMHYDHIGHEEWVNSIHATKFLDDVLIIAGNVADSFRALERALIAVRAKFRRVFYVPGNHEMWITRNEDKRFPDSFCKLWAIVELCDALDIDIFPATVCKDVYIVPLLSWHNAQFDAADPFPDPSSEANRAAKWPIDKEQQLWRYMLRLNQAHMDKPYHGTVITFSHFAPRTSCPVWPEKEIRKTSGCPELDEQLRDARSVCHVYGHTLYRFNQVVDGVKYIHRPLHVEMAIDGTVSKDPLACVFNGESLCFDLVDI